MRARTLPDRVARPRRTVVAGRSLGFRIATLGLVPAGLLAPAAAWAGPPPAACGGIPTITDATGDGHHQNTDVTAAWLTETGGRLQAVIQVSQASWAPAHDDSDAATFALLFQVGGAGPTRYVRALAPRNAPIKFDTGTWTRAGGFVSDGVTTGDSSTGGGGAVTIDVPTTGGVTSGAVLARPFVLTADGGVGADLHWVDAAPGGTSPDTASAGADYVVGACGASAQPGLPGIPPPTPPAPGPTGPGLPALTGVGLKAPARVTGAKTVRVTGSVTPAQAGVAVTLTQSTRGAPSGRTLTASTAADGTFSIPVKVSERSTWRATAAGLGSQTLTTQVKARVAGLSVRRTASGGLVVRGSVSPQLPGRVLWLRTDAVSPSATTSPARGRFVLRVAHPKPGRYQALFIPSKARAERALSRTESIR